jgi:hypothetical protein
LSCLLRSEVLRSLWKSPLRFSARKSYSINFSSFLNSGYRQSGAPRHDKSRWNGRDERQH